MQKNSIVKCLVHPGTQTHCGLQHVLICVVRSVSQPLFSQQHACRVRQYSCCQFQIVQTCRLAKTEVSHRYDTSITKETCFHAKPIRGLENVKLTEDPGGLHSNPSPWLSPEQLVSCPLSLPSAFIAHISFLTFRIVLCSLQEALTYNISFVLLYPECRKEQKVIMRTDCKFIRCMLQKITPVMEDPPGTASPFNENSAHNQPLMDLLILCLSRVIFL